MKQVSYQVNYTQVENTCLDDPRIRSDYQSFDDKAKARAFVDKLLKGNEFWKTTYCCIATFEVYR